MTPHSTPHRKDRDDHSSRRDHGQKAAGRPRLLHEHHRRRLDHPRGARRGRDLPRRAEHPRDRRKAGHSAEWRIQFLGVRLASRLRDGVGRGHRPHHRHADLHRSGPLHLALRTAPDRPVARIRHRSAGGRAIRRVRAVGHPGAGAGGAAVLRLAERARRLDPAVRRRCLGHRPHHPHRGDRARRHGAADHDRGVPRGLPADAEAARGGCARPRRHPVGDDPGGRAALRPPRHHLGRDARTRPGTRRDHGGRDGALPRRRRLVLPADLAEPEHHRREHRAAIPGGRGDRREHAHRIRTRALRHHFHRQRDRALRRQPPQGILGSQLMTTTTAGPITNSLTAGRLPRGAVWALLLGSWVLLGVVFLLIQLGGGTKEFNLIGALFLGTVLFDILIYVVSLLIEGARKAIDRLVTSLVATAFVVAVLPLVSLIYTVALKGLPRMVLPSFFTESMRNILGPGGGALHAVIGTVEVTAFAALISVPIGLLTAIYLVEYGTGILARTITFLVDVMTGIPSIVAGLFAFALFALLTGDPGFRSGFGGSVALSVLMIPVVVRSSEEMLKL